MDHRGGTARAQRRLQCGAVPHVALYAGQRLSGDAFHPIQGFGFAVAVVVKDRNGIARIEQLHAGVAADVASTAGDENEARAIPGCKTR